MKRIAKSKLIRSLSALPPTELSRFRDFVHSPFFNKHEPTQYLADYLLLHQSSWGEVTKQELSSELFPGEPFREALVNNIMSNLTQLLHRFLAQLGLEDEDMEEELALEAALSREVFPIFRAGLNKARKGLSLADPFDPATHRKRHRFALLEHKFLSSLENQYTVPSITASISGLDAWYTHLRLRYGVALKSLRVAHGAKDTDDWLPVLQRYVQERSEGEWGTAVWPLHQQALEVLSNMEDESQYRALADLITEHESRLQLEDLEQLYKVRLDFCIRRVNAHSPYFQEELFRIYQMFLTTGTLIQRGQMLQVNYNNITSVACNVREYEWAARFVKDYADKLPAHGRENAYRYNMANVFFHLKDYDSARSLLLQVDFTNIYYKLKTKFLQVKIYYELGETQLLESTMDSLRIFMLRARRLSSDLRIGVKHYLQFGKRLSEASNMTGRQQKSAVRRLRKDLNAVQAPVLNKAWIEEQLNILLPEEAEA